MQTQTEVRPTSHAANPDETRLYWLSDGSGSFQDPTLMTWPQAVLAQQDADAATDGTWFWCGGLSPALLDAVPELLAVVGNAIPRLAELDKLLNPTVDQDTAIDDSAGRVLRAAHDVFLKAGGLCTCGFCRAQAEGR